MPAVQSDRIVELVLNRHCIQTAVKRAYENLISRYFARSAREEDQQILETQIGMLKFFLEHADFSKLRFQYPELSGTTTVQAILIADENRENWKIVCNDKTIRPEWKDLLGNG